MVRTTLCRLRSHIPSAGSLKGLLRHIRLSVDTVVSVVAAVVAAVVSIVAMVRLLYKPVAGIIYWRVTHCVATDTCAFNLGRHNHLGPDHGYLMLSVPWLHAAQDW